MVTAFLSVCLALFVTTDVMAQPVAPAARKPVLVVQDAWIRAVPGSDTASAYMTLHNLSGSPVTVVGVQTPIAGHAMIHETQIEGGQSRMRAHEHVVVAPGQIVKLEPGGLHVMLHGLTQPVTVGQHVQITLQLAGGSTVQVAASVRPLSAG